MEGRRRTWDRYVGAEEYVEENGGVVEGMEGEGEAKGCMENGGKG